LEVQWDVIHCDEEGSTTAGHEDVENDHGGATKEFAGEQAALLCGKYTVILSERESCEGNHSDHVEGDITTRM
jgi:hypothetical protein